jgi:hypothetical protein
VAGVAAVAVAVVAAVGAQKSHGRRRSWDYFNTCQTMVGRVKRGGILFLMTWRA